MGRKSGCENQINDWAKPFTRTVGASMSQQKDAMTNIAWQVESLYD
jgi:hypothetical protein